MAQADDRGPVRPTSSGGRNLTLAVGSAVLFAVLFVASVFINPWALLSFVAVIMVIAVLEVDAALRTADLRPPTAVVLLVGVPMLGASYTYGANGQLTALVVMVLGIMIWVLADRNDPVPVRNAGAAILMGMWIPFLGSFLALLLRRPGGEWFIVITVALTAASDIAAYAVGSRLGRRKLAPAISPGKTWEGAAGGVVASMLVAGVAAPVLVEELSLARALALGALVAVVAVSGDLAESAVKRSLGVKDLGRVLPGHGGIMDRVDAMLFTLPVAHLVLLAGRL